MRKSTLTLAVAAMLLMTVASALSSGTTSFLEWYDDFALRNIWRNMAQYALMWYTRQIICNLNLQSYMWPTLADSLTLDQAAEDAGTTAMEGSAYNTYCQEFIEDMQLDTWGSKGKYKWTYGSFSDYDYSP